MGDTTAGASVGAGVASAGGRTAAQDGGIRATATALRIVGAAAAVGVLSVADEPRWAPEHFGYALALGWIPATGLLSVIQRRHPGVIVDVLTAILDLGVLLGLLLGFPGAAATVFAAEIITVGFYSYLRGWGFGVTVAVGALGVDSVPAIIGEPLGVPGVSVALAPVWLVVAIVLVEALRRERAHISDTLGIARDRTGAILTGVNEAVIVTSPRGRIRELNDAAARIFECDRETATGANCSELLGLHHDIEELDCSQGCALLQASVSGDYDLRVWRARAGEGRQPLLAHASPIVDAQGRVAEVVHSFRDITKLVEAEEAKTLFLATASHELKTPLTVIVGYSELMLRQPDLEPAAREQGMKAIHERARQLTGIVNRILLSSRIESGRVELRTRPADVLAAIEESVLNLAGGASRKCDVEIVPELPEALVDDDALRTVLDHLLDNAAKYSPPDAPIALRADADEEAVILAVTDVGIGMSADEAERCFDRFWQAESGDVRRFGGSGIGLYIVQSLMAAMRGEVTVESQPGSGSTFTLRLPRADRVQVASAPAHDVEPSIIREFMKQVGVGGGGGGGT